MAALVAGHPLAARIEATRPAHQAWVAVYPQRRRADVSAPIVLNAAVPADIRLRVSAFEVADERLSPDRWLSEEDVVRTRDDVVAGRDALVEALTEHGVTLASLERPWAVDLPL
ncbi:MAG: hypothetical protein IPH44_34425 [Myxococcales bacterium]|nr:hypothetical protein [Myxococcales bacterium]